MFDNTYTISLAGPKLGRMKMRIQLSCQAQAGTEPEESAHTQCRLLYTLSMRAFLYHLFMSTQIATLGRDTYTGHDELFQSAIFFSQGSINPIPTSTSSTIDVNMASMTCAIDLPSNCHTTVPLLREFLHFHSHFGLLMNRVVVPLTEAKLHAANGRLVGEPHVWS